MKSKKIKTRNLPQDRMVVRTVRLKPLGLCCGIFMAGVALLLLRPRMMTLGIVIMLLGLFATFIMPDRILCEFSLKYMVIYNQRDTTQCMIIYYDELFSWEYEKHGTSDLLVLTLKDGSVETQEMYSRASILSPMNSYAPNKEIRHRKRKGASA